RNRLKSETDDGDGGCADLAELQPAGDDRLVEAIGELAAESGKNKKRSNQDRPAQSGQDFPAGGAELEHNQDDQRIPEEIVVEGGEELAPEDRREAPRAHQSAEHGLVLPE